MTPTKFSRFPKPRVMAAARKGDETVSAPVPTPEPEHAISAPLDVNSPDFLAKQAVIRERVIAGDLDPLRPVKSPEMAAVAAKPRRKPASKPKRVTALQRAALRLEAARAPVYAVRGRVADAFLSTVSPLALALAMPTDYPWLRRRLFAPEVYRLDPFRKRAVILV